MKTKLNSLSILCAIFICSACGNSAVNTKTVQIASDSVPTITIRLPDIDSLQNLYLSEIVDSVYYVALSEKPFLATDNLRVETTDSVMIVGPAGASYGDERVRLYDLKGNFKRQIGGGDEGQESIFIHIGV